MSNTAKPAVVSGNGGQVDGGAGQRVSYFIESLSRSILAVVIGLALTGLFTAVVLAILYMSLTDVDSQDAHLLNTVLTLVAAALSAVLGYAFGRNSSQERK